jgi:alkylhydroperoxidase family enzyme
VLGRAEGLTEEKLAHLGDDPLPEGVYTPDEAAIVRYAQVSARNDPITSEVYGELARHFPVETQVQISFVVGFAGLINRFHSTFLTEVDPETQEILAVSCPVRLPAVPATA